MVFYRFFPKVQPGSAVRLLQGRLSGWDLLLWISAFAGSFFYRLVTVAFVRIHPALEPGLLPAGGPTAVVPGVWMVNYGMAGRGQPCWFLQMAKRTKPDLWEVKEP